jgi:hypothetical protein
MLLQERTSAFSRYHQNPELLSNGVARRNTAARLNQLHQAVDDSFIGLG